jgi:hypothetical protein
MPTNATSMPELPESMESEPLAYAASLPASTSSTSTCTGLGAFTGLTHRRRTQRGTQGSRTQRSPIATAPYTSQVFKCLNCHQELASKQRLQSHQARACKADKMDQYSKCSQCGKVVKNSHLLKHQKSQSECSSSLHIQTTRVECKWCKASLLPARVQHHIRYDCPKFKEHCGALDSQSWWLKFKLANMTSTEIPAPDRMTDRASGEFARLVFWAEGHEQEFDRLREQGLIQFNAGRLLHRLRRTDAAWGVLQREEATVSNIDQSLTFCAQDVFAAGTGVGLPKEYLNRVCGALAQMVEYEITVDSKLEEVTVNLPPLKDAWRLQALAMPSKHNPRGACVCFFCTHNVRLPLADLKTDRAYMRAFFYKSWLETALSQTPPSSTDQGPVCLPPLPTNFTYRSECCPGFLFCKHSFASEYLRVQQLARYLYGREMSKPTGDCVACAGVPESIEHVVMHCPLYAQLREDCTKELAEYEASWSLALVLGDASEYIDRHDDQRAEMLTITAAFLLRVIRKREFQRAGIDEHVAGNPFDSDEVLQSARVLFRHSRIVGACTRLGISL